MNNGIYCNYVIIRQLTTFAPAFHDRKFEMFLIDFKAACRPHLRQSQNSY